jgi:hypothetical protein
VRKSRAYELDRQEAGLRWQPDRDTTVTASVRGTDYDAPFNPDRNYEDKDFSLRGQRRFSPRWPGDLAYGNRSKRFDVEPSSDLDQATFGGGLSYNPDQDWSFFLRLDHGGYDYADPSRAYDNDNLSLGGSYSRDRFNAGLNFSRSDNSFSSDPLRDYQNTRLGLDAGYNWERHSLSAYWSRSELSQSDPASTNGYTEDCLGGRWQFKLDEDVDLELSYDRSLRDYQAGDNLEDNRVSARLEFEL